VEEGLVCSVSLLPAEDLSSLTAKRVSKASRQGGEGQACGTYDGVNLLHVVGEQRQSVRSKTSPLCKEMKRCSTCDCEVDSWQVPRPVSHRHNEIHRIFLAERSTYRLIYYSI
jgi:hypothetical protein